MTYNSGATKGLSQKAGAGWDLNQDYIERDVNYTPNNSDTGDDKFKIHLHGSTQDLISVASESAYHTKIESHLNIKKLTTANDSGEYWQVITTDGTKYRFGQTTNSELMCNTRTYAYRWNLELVEDTHGNKIYYTYSESNGGSKLTKLEYNTEKARVVDFDYDTNPYQRTFYSQGCKITEGSRLMSVQVKANSNLVHKFDLNYQAAINGNQLLTGITEKGSTMSASLPPTKFSYFPELKGWKTTAETWLNHFGFDAPLDSNNATLIDVTGDGLPDMVKSEGNGNNTWKVWKNTGVNFSTATETPWINNYGLDAKLERLDTKLIDVTGDNLPDVIKMHNDSGTLTYKVVKNTGHSWDTSNITDWVSNTSLNGTNITDNNTTIADVNGDNLADIVRSQTGDSTKWWIYKNTGSSWNTSYEEWTIPTSVDLTMNNLRLLDVDGDGLQDIVTTSVSGSNSTWNVYPNTGSGWETSPTAWISSTNIGDGDLTKTNVSLADVNGDGLPDIVRSTESSEVYKWQVLLNLGNRWSTSWQIWLNYSDAIPAGSHDTKVRIADVNGDGRSDIIRGKADCACAEDTFEVWSNNGNSTDLMSTITTSLGGLTSFEYASTSAVFDNTGSDTYPDLPFGMQVVKKMTVSNGMTGALATSDVTTYSYQDGLYDWEDKEFRGFAVVDTVEPNTARKKYVFHQSDALQGLLAEVQTRNSSGDPFAETENTWSNSLYSGIYTVNLIEEKDYTYDGSASNPKIIRTGYQYDNYGNLRKKSEYGDNDVLGDERFTYNDYTASPSGWIVNTLKNTYVNAANDSTKVSQSLFYYDGHTGLGDEPTKGDVTKEVKWLSGGSNPEIKYEYDSYGNVTKVTDPNDNDTTYTFDTTHTFPESVTNAKSQQTNITYDLGTGNVLSKTDPNGIVLDYEYDVFGRFAKEIRPYDTNEFPTVYYEYDFDGIAPEKILVRQREEGNSLNTVDTFTYVDGLNRKVQTRADAEDSTKQIVIDTYYDPTGEIRKETVPYIATSSATLSSPPATKFGDGSNGNKVISSNETETPIDSAVTATSGTNTATVGTGLGFATNQIVLFHQTQGAGAGLWEFARVQSYIANNLVLASTLTNSYSSSGTNRAQVRVVPQYNNVTVNSGVTWTAKAWNGTTGGILAFLASGTATISGTINATGKGFNGATVAAFVNGNQGEGNTGAGTQATSANGNGGGGNSNPYGAGGGGNGTAGTTVSSGGTGVATAGAADLATIEFGGGGGAGDDASSGSGGNNFGGNGGGNIFIQGASVSVLGSITANGISSGVPNSGSHGGGGGGAGGSILVKSQTATLGSSLITANGGSGGNGSGTGTAGGNGGNGRIRVEYETSISGSTSPAANTEEMEISQNPSAVTEYASFDPSTKFTELTYDPIGRVNIITNTKGGNKTIAYDHWKETEMDENYHIKRSYRNAYGKIQKVEELIGVTPHATNYVYNSLDQLTQIIDSASNSATINYDTLGRKTSHVDPDMGTWTYSYDAAGNQTSTTDARNITVGRTYDELNRLTGIIYPTDSDVSFLYDTGKIGTLSIATDSAGTVFYTYDDRLRKTEETRVIGGTSKTTQFTYDSADRLINQKNPDDTESNYTFNDQGEIETLDGILDNVDYNAQGKITRKEFNNGLDTNYTYNTDDFRLNRIQTGSLQDLNYSYDPVGNITNIYDDVSAKTKIFTYDDLDRLVSASESAGFNYAYEYNPIGNLTKFTSAGADIEYEYGAGSAGPHAMTSTSGTASESAEIELLGAPSTIASSSGEALDEQSVDPNILNGKTTVKVTLDLNGDSFGLGDDEASVVFIQGGEWMAANIIPYAQNGYDGVQTVEIPLSAFYKVNDTEHLDTESTTSGMRVRFWNDEPFSVDVTSVKVTDGPVPNEMELLINPWSLEVATSGDDVKYHDIPAYSLKGKTTASITFDLHGTSFGSGDDEASIVFLQGSDWMAANVIPYGTNGQNGPQTVDIPLSAFQKVNDTPFLDTEADVDQVIGRFWNDEPFNVDVTSVKVFGDEEEEASESGEVNIAPNGTGYRWSQNSSGTSNSNRVTSTGVNDGNEATDVDLNNGSDDNADAWEAAGVVWSASQSAITSVQYINGTWDGNNNGAFTANVKLQFTTDGTTWTDSGWTISPAYDNDNSAASGKTYTFTGTSTTAKGARVVGQVRTTASNSWHAFAREIKIIQNGNSETNISSSGTGYRWSQNTSANSNSNRVAATGMNDGNESTDIDLNNGSDDNADAWEAAGLVWSASQSAITKVEYKNGTWDGNNNGAFTANFKLQFTYDGTIWIDSGWEESPAYDHDSSAASGKTYTFTGSPVTAKGARVVGQVRTTGADSWHAFAREVKVYTGTESTSGSTMTYDANGNMTSEGGKCYEYNDANQMIRVKNCSSNQTIAEYIYDYKGQRLVKKNYTSGTLANTVISWSNSFETKDAGGSISTTNYFFANGELVAKKNPDGSKYYYHNDHLNSAVVITNQAGSLVEETKFDPWGQVLAGATQSKFLYTGQEHDAETGLHYYDARYYDPALRRFTQPDTIVQDIYNPQALNRYSYTLNNPLKYNDPTGHFAGLISLISAVKGLISIGNTVSTAVASNTPKAPPVSTAKLPNNPVFQQPIVKSSGGSTSSGGGGGGALATSRHSQSPNTQGAQDIYNLVIGDDIKTIQNPNVSIGQKAFVLASNAPQIKGPKIGFKVAKVLTRNVSGGAATANTILKSADEWLGPNYRQIGKVDRGIFRSEDDLRQVRMNDTCLVGSSCHVHFQSVAEDGRQFVETSHVDVLDGL